MLHNGWLWLSSQRNILILNLMKFFKINAETNERITVLTEYERFLALLAKTYWLL